MIVASNQDVGHYRLVADRWKESGSLVVTVVVLGILIWWLVIVGSKLGLAPTVVGKTVTLDEYQRSKDILLVVLPLATTAVGFWLGNQNTQQVKDQAAKTETATQQQLTAAVATAEHERAVADSHQTAAAAAQVKAHQAELQLRDATARTQLVQQQLDLITTTLAEDPRAAFVAGSDVASTALQAVVDAVAAHQSLQRGAAHLVYDGSANEQSGAQPPDPTSA